jgi:hypothetical protein
MIVKKNKFLKIHVGKNTRFKKEIKIPMKNAPSGTIGYLFTDNPALSGYNYILVIKIYDGFVNFNNPHQTWSNLAEDSYYIIPLVKGTKIVITV